jgi:hypothetical protein
MQGVFLRQPGGSSVLTQLGHLFEETPAQLRSACERAAAAEAAAAPAQAGAPPADDKATSTAGNSAAGGLPAEQTSAAADAVGLDAASNGQAGAAADGRAAVGSRPASELNVVREGSMELDYGTDDGGAPQLQAHKSRSLDPFHAHQSLVACSFLWAMHEGLSNQSRLCVTCSWSRTCDSKTAAAQMQYSPRWRWGRSPARRGVPACAPISGPTAAAWSAPTSSPPSGL